MDGDLISRKALLKAIDEREKLVQMLTANVYDEAEMTVSLSALRKFVNNRPAVDAEPVRHGKCELCGRGKPIKAFTVLPECGLQCGPSIMARYCPHCGARMRGDDSASE